MNAMQPTLRGFAITIALLWTAGCIGGILFAQQQNIPGRVVAAVLPAILAEALFWVGSVMEEPRRWFEGLKPAFVRAIVLAGTAVLPLLLYTLPLGLWRPRAAAELFGLALLVALWFVVFPSRDWSVLLLLLVMAVVLLSKVLVGLYPRPDGHLRLDFLGQMMWYRLGIMAYLSFGGMPGVRLGFLPEGREWLIGAKWFAMFLPAAWLCNLAIGFAKYRPPALPAWQATLLAAATFAGILWVVALREEFFFRGVLQQWLSKQFGDGPGLGVASVLFGTVHLWFRQFPNWRFAILAAIAGVFYGLAFREGRGVRAAMVAHALVVTVWRTFFV